MTIERLTLNDPEAQSADPVAANIAALKALFPAAMADGRIDFDALRQLLGDEVDDGDERYGLNWPGKRRARRLALTPSTGTLRPARQDSVDWDTTRNLMIEGDNLEVLKLLQKSYAGKVKLIYIDPPYNTGNDFVYPDDFTDSLAKYLRHSGQVGDDGAANTTNPETGGRYHTNWLNMIYPRLLVARSLLSKDGLIAISIDENEVDNLRQVCDTVFGEENHVGSIARATGTPTGGGNKKLVGEIDYLLIYSKDPAVDIEGVGFTEEDASIYDKEDEKGRYLTRSLRRTGGEDRREDRPSMYYGVAAPDGTLVYPIGPGGYESRWICGADRYHAMVEEGLIEWISREGEGGRTWHVHQKFYLEGRSKQPSNFWSKLEGNKKATRDLRALFEGNKVFSNPKPVGLLTHLIEICGVKSGDIVMDFFAGSGTTAHAVMQKCAEDGQHRRYLLVQLPEPLFDDDRAQDVAAEFCDQLGKPRNLAEITKERLRRAAAQIQADHPDAQTDLGFRVYKLATSNLRAWEPGGDLAADLLAAADNVVPDRSEEDLLTELLLKQGIDLTEPMLTETIAGAPVHAMGGGVLVVCLAPVTTGNAEALADGIADWIERLDPVAASTVFFKDAGFENDVAKANVAAILEQRLEDKLLKVRSL